jgi:hypothetical protein
MNKELSSRQMINVELAARANNRRSSKLLKHHTPKAEQAGLKILFNCECADPNCHERILLTLTEYERLHENHAQFVILKTHFAPKVEQVTHAGKDVAVVEKFALS